jgi:hypothetical protein
VVTGLKPRCERNVRRFIWLAGVVLFKYRYIGRVSTTETKLRTAFALALHSGCELALVAALGFNPNDVLLLQTAHIGNKRIDLGLGKFLSPSGHLAFSVGDRVENSLIANLRLPLGVGKISRVIELCLECLSLTILSVTGIAALVE